MSKFAVLLLAAGKSSRFGDEHYKKPFAALEDRAVWIHSAERFLERDDVVQVMLVISPDDKEDFQRRFGANLAFMNMQCTIGGAERSDSVCAGLAKISPDATHVAVHDAARPCVTTDEINRLFQATLKHDAVILATPVASTLKRVCSENSEGMPAISETVSREGLWAAQTPQAFTVELLKRAHAEAGDAPVTDDSQLVEQLGTPVAIVEGSPMNLKITTKQDLQLASSILRSRPIPTPKGTGNPFGDNDMWR